MLKNWRMLAGWNGKNTLHRNTDLQIEKFHVCKAKLDEIDKKLAGFVGVFEAGSWLLGVNTLSANIVFFAGVYLYGYFIEKRQEHFQEYQLHLKELIKSYHELALNQEATVTENPEFLRIAEVIAPYVMTADMIFWERNHTPKFISSQFRAILEHSPHKVYFLSLEQAAEHAEQKQGMANRVSSKMQWYGLFEQTYAEVNRVIYGLQPEEEKLKLN